MTQLPCFFNVRRWGVDYVGSHGVYSTSIWNVGMKNNTGYFTLLFKEKLRVREVLDEEESTGLLICRSCLEQYEPSF